MRDVIYTIWQVIVKSGRPKRLALLAVRVLSEAITIITLVAITQAGAAVLLPRGAGSLRFVHFYICKAKRCENCLKEL